MSRIFNFSAGPATLPLPVLEEAKKELVDFKATGMSLMEASHRGKAYAPIHEEVTANLKALLGLDDDYSVLLLQGGASMQFAMLPMNKLEPDATATYVATGAWAAKAIKEARIFGNVHIAADTSNESPARIPTNAELDVVPDSAYLHITSNETISGTQWKIFPLPDGPMVADMSSDILSRSFDANDFDMIYAGAQKNLGPAGVTVVAIRKSFAEQAKTGNPTMLDYRTHIAKDSLFNTPPTFAIYMLSLVIKWVLTEGQQTIYDRNKRKASLLYDAIDASSFYSGCADVASRSDMNVTFRLPTASLEADFVQQAEMQGLCGLRGHRSVGGLRASIYNAFPEEGVQTLIDFMSVFEKENG